MWWPLYVFNLCSFMLLCFPSWVASLPVSPPYLCHNLCVTLWVSHYDCHIICVTLCVSYYVCNIMCLTFCVSHFVCYILCVTFCVSHFVYHIVPYLPIGETLRWVNCDKYCMAHGLCPLAKIIRKLDRNSQKSSRRELSPTITTLFCIPKYSTKNRPWLHITEPL